MKARSMLLALCTATSLVCAQEDTKIDPAAEITSVVTTHQKMMTDFIAKVRALPKEKQRSFYRDNYPKSDDSVTTLEKLIKAHPKNPAVIEAMTFIAKTTRGKGLDATHFAILEEHHFDNEKLGQLTLPLAYAQSEEANAFLQTISKESKNHDVRGTALYAMSMGMKRNKDKAEEYGALVEKLIADHPNLKISGREVVKAIVAERKAAKLLAIGNQAPEIIGKDVDGKEMKLSDYKGQVVVLDFWGDW